MLTSPDRRWAVILDQEEGLVSGFFLISPECVARQIDFLPRTTMISLTESPEPRFANRDTLQFVATFTTQDGAVSRKQILIRKDGWFEIAGAR